ncbi:acyl-CoA dehydrogenase [candidate division WOR-3 bacterium]|uniref:Acyl-CoA dehydrogenase n=1 Tax=candidate division WOR-3 bacterium TaxID=2052148 RepID=A0A660SFK5_UNCW3|nr:MAG: acyl-CoA dehydrogenase [candidate division WOR-3 bacterium]
MEYFLSDRQKELRERTRRVAETVIKPRVQELEKHGDLIAEVRSELVAAGLYKIFVPPEYGGEDFGILELSLVVEELARVCAGVATAYAATGLGSMPLIVSGNEEQKQRYLTRIARGEIVFAFGLTEPEAGSDAANVKTKAVKDGDYYIINGQKQFITNGGVADVYTIFASTNPARGARGISAFLVEKGTPGFEIGKEEEKLGIKASKTCQLLFNDCRVPKENLLGKEGLGYIAALRTFDRTRPGVAAVALGIAQGALEAAARRSGGLKDDPKVQKILADIATKVEAARALIYATARMIDAGVKRFTKESAMSKVFASDVAMEATIEAIQVLGEKGLLKDYEVEKMMRDAKITQIYEGTNEIQRLVIASELIKEYA